MFFFVKLYQNKKSSVKWFQRDIYRFGHFGQ